MQEASLYVSLARSRIGDAVTAKEAGEWKYYVDSLRKREIGE